MKVAVIGAGLGGLAAAIRLSAAGHEVAVFEKNTTVGGKMNTLRLGGYSFDTGPTLLTMPFVLEDLFAAAGERMSEHLDVLPLHPSCRYFFPDGATLDTTNDAALNEEAISRFSPRDAGAYTRFMRHAESIYKAAAEPFMFSGFGSWTARDVFRSLRHLPSVPRLDSRRTLAEAVSGYFADERLRQLFNRFATYNGSSPFRAPATLAIIPHVEFAFGGWRVAGGMYRIAEELRALALRHGAMIHSGTAVEQILVAGGRARGLRLADGTAHHADVVISNADAHYTVSTLLSESRAVRHTRYARLEPSLAGFIMYLGVRRCYTQLAHHNIFFSPDYRKEFTQIFDEERPADTPTVYVSAGSTADPDQAPPGCMNLFVLVNAPALNGNIDWTTRGPEYRNSIVRLLETAGLEDLGGNIEEERVVTPAEFERMTNAPHGSIYGSSSNNRFAAFLRPPNRSRDLRGLYFAGGSAHPGGGIPLVLLSGKITAELVEADHD